MKEFVPPKPERYELYEHYLKRFLEAMADHYNEFLKELQHDRP